jgi:rhomboid protease GluP
MNQDYPSQYPPPSPRPQGVRVSVPQTRPVVTYTLLGVSIAVYAVQYATQNFLGFDYPAALGLKVNDLIVQGQLWRLFTPMFLHGSILHIALNMYALLIFGPQLERFYGHARYLALYLVSGFAGNVASFLFSLAPSLGSSTAIFGLLGAEAVFLYSNRKIFGSSAQRSLINLIVIAVLNLVIGFSPGVGIDNWGHIGGLLGGVLFAWFGGPVLQVGGAYPDLEMVDTRSTNSVILAGLGVLLLFALLAGFKIFTAG